MNTMNPMDGKSPAEIELMQITAKYNKLRENFQKEAFSYPQLKTLFENIGIPCSYENLPNYEKFEIVSKTADNKYTLRKKVVYYKRLGNALAI